MKKDRHVSTFSEGSRIDGYIVFSSPNVLYVEITYPFKGITGKTMVIPNHMETKMSYIDAQGFVTDKGRAAAKQVLLDIYGGALFVKEKRQQLLKLYENYRQQKLSPNEITFNEAIEEALYYSLFNYAITVYHKKVSYDIFRQLIKKFVIER